jgi:hypothetical protein
LVDKPQGLTVLEAMSVREVYDPLAQETIGAWLQQGPQFPASQNHAFPLSHRVACST